MVKSIRGILGPVLIGAGILLFVSPVVVYWFIHGDPERYLWIISGPAPFSSFGGGPFQLYLYAGLVIAGILAIASGIVAQRGGRVPRASPHRTTQPSFTNSPGSEFRLRPFLLSP